MSIWTKAFWKAASERAIKTAAQSGLLVIGADQLNILTLDWVNLGGFAAGGALISVLTSIASAAATDGSPSLGGERLEAAKRALPEDDLWREI